MIKVCAIDGFKTLKAYDYIEDDLLFVYEDYYSSLSKETKQKFDSLLAVQFICGVTTSEADDDGSYS